MRRSTSKVAGARGGGAVLALVASLQCQGSAAPVIDFAGPVGGSGFDIAHDAAVDAAGNLYLTGSTASADFPVAAPYQGALAGDHDVFVVKIDPATPALLQATYLGGAGFDTGFHIELDGTGGVWICGSTLSTDFPVVNAPQPRLAGDRDAFVAHLDATGSVLLASTYLGGSGRDFASALTLDAAGNVYLTGVTWSSDFPVRQPFQPSLAGAGDVFVTKLDPSASAIIYSSYLGGPFWEVGNDLAIDSSGNVVITGVTLTPGGQSSLFPVVNPLQATAGGHKDAFLSKVDPTGASLIYSTYLGGRWWDEAYGLALDPAGGALIVGRTDSPNFPTARPVQPQSGGGSDAFLARIDPSGSTLTFSTYLGGGGSDIAHDVALDASGQALVTGITDSDDFPLEAATQPARAGGVDAFVAALHPTDGILVHASYLGGSADEAGQAVASDPSRGIVAVGSTGSADFPSNRPLQGYAGGTDAFVSLTSCGLRVMPDALPRATQLSGYSATLAAAGEVPPVTFGIASGALPPGLSLLPSGLLSGVPSPAATYSFEVLARDATGCTGTRGFALQVCGAIEPTPPSLPVAIAGAPYAVTISASYGTSPYVFALAAGVLPPGLSLATSGTISGTPTAAGSYSFTVRATDAVACPGDRAYVLDVGASGCSAIALLPAMLPPAFVGAPYTQVLSASGGSPPYGFALDGGTLPPGITLSAMGTLSGTVTAPGSFTFTAKATDAAGCRGNRVYRIDIGESLVTGQGLGQPNANRVRVHTASGQPTPLDLYAYAAGAWGSNVATGELDGGATDEILAAPGPGPTLGPLVRAFRRDGSAMAKVNFYAYGTLRFGANVASADVEADGYGEIVTGAGPGAVFGPHVRGFDVDGALAAAIPRIGFFAYSTVRYGASAGGGDVEADGFSEILTAPGPGAVFAPNIRGWNDDGLGIVAIAGLNFWAFATPRYGARVAGGDADGDGFDEIAASHGPGSGLPARFRGFHWDGVAIAPLPGFDVTPLPGSYGGSVGLGDVSGEGPSDLLAGSGPDPAVASTVQVHRYDGTALSLFGSPFDSFPPSRYGVNAQSGRLGQ